ncbi:hypothetical protein GPALN_013076 [Globodera pallida]|nr:hypothetical protein GPALN_013076 [Globodera pallida]
MVLGRLGICRGKKGKVAQIVKRFDWGYKVERRLPILRKSLPGKVIGFECLEILHRSKCHRISPNTSVAELDCLRQFSPTILRDCAKLRLINVFDLFPEFPADDSASVSSAQALVKWLHVPRGDGLPKVLEFRFCLDSPHYLLRLRMLAVKPGQNADPENGDWCCRMGGGRSRTADVW